MSTRRLSWCAVLLAALLAAACSTSGSDTATVEQTADPTSIVQLGDSIASGEGTLYGYTYDAKTKKWVGGDVNAEWPEPYPSCHDSPDAYGQVLATSLDAKFTQFACTGATFDAGIEAPELDDGKPMRPAQFGNWANRTDINKEYDETAPDLVLVTLGADDVRFSAIVRDCLTNAFEHASGAESLRCVSDNPGETIEQDYFDFLPTLTKNYGTLVDWIEKRAKANGEDAPPEVVFSNYANPLPPDGVTCPDTSVLSSEQLTYLSGLVGQLDDLIEKTITALAKDHPNVGFVDFSEAYTVEGTSHDWCSDDPWVYGLSIYSVSDPSSFNSQAPFHPTPAGQKRLASLVEPVVKKLFDES